MFDLTLLLSVCTHVHARVRTQFVFPGSASCVTGAFPTELPRERVQRVCQASSRAVLPPWANFLTTCSKVPCEVQLSLSHVASITVLERPQDTDGILLTVHLICQHLDLGQATRGENL